MALLDNEVALLVAVLERSRPSCQLPTGSHNCAGNHAYRQPHHDTSYGKSATPGAHSSGSSGPHHPPPQTEQDPDGQSIIQSFHQNIRYEIYLLT